MMQVTGRTAMHLRPGFGRVRLPRVMATHERGAAVDGKVMAKLVVLPYEILWFWFAPIDAYHVDVRFHHDLASDRVQAGVVTRADGWPSALRYYCLS